MGAAGRAGAVGARLGWWCFETTTPLTSGTYEAARSAVDCALAATDAVLGGERVAYGLCRPPGHHATTSLYGGYCFFNNAAIAAAPRRRRRRARGSPCSTSTTTTATARSRSSTSATTSRSCRCTATRRGPTRTTPGIADETGAGRGSGATSNVPLPAGTDDDAYLAALEPALRRRSTRSTRTSSSCRSASTRTSTTRCATSRSPPTGFGRCGAAVAALGRPLVVLQEGGYADDALGANVRRWLLGAAALA